MKSITVVGGGIVGLAVAREIKLRGPDLKVAVLEKESDIATHQTRHNSGVIHSGIYYPPGSAKALTCQEGVHLLGEFCDLHKIERKRFGKLIVAVRTSEFGGLERLHQQGLASKIQNLRIVSREEILEMEPAISGLKALYLPDVSVVDFQKVGQALRMEVEKAGGTIHLLQKVKRIRFSHQEVLIETDRDTYSTDYLVNCAGLYSDWVARVSGCKVPVRIIPFRGEYFLLRKQTAAKIRHLIYPIPDSRFPFLGVHLTPTLNGEVTVGPNAVLALAREGYSWEKVNLAEIFDYLTYGGFWRMAFKYGSTGLFELMRSILKPVYTASARNFLPGLKSSDLLPGDSGVRAQAVNGQGEFIHDFLYIQQPRATHILNAPSPAATASLAIAKRIADLVQLQ